MTLVSIDIKDILILKLAAVIQSTVPSIKYIYSCQRDKDISFTSALSDSNQMSDDTTDRNEQSDSIAFHSFNVCILQTSHAAVDAIEMLAHFSH